MPDSLVIRLPHDAVLSRVIRSKVDLLNKNPELTPQWVIACGPWLSGKSHTFTRLVSSRDEARIHNDAVGEGDFLPREWRAGFIDSLALAGDLVSVGKPEEFVDRFARRLVGLSFFRTVAASVVDFEQIWEEAGRQSFCRWLSAKTRTVDRPSLLRSWSGLRPTLSSSHGLAPASFEDESLPAEIIGNMPRSEVREDLHRYLSLVIWLDRFERTLLSSGGQPCQFRGPAPDPDVISERWRLFYGKVRQYTMNVNRQLMRLADFQQMVDPFRVLYLAEAGFLNDFLECSRRGSAAIISPQEGSSAPLEQVWQRSVAQCGSCAFVDNHSPATPLSEVDLATVELVYEPLATLNRAHPVIEETLGCPELHPGDTGVGEAGEVNIPILIRPKDPAVASQIARSAGLEAQSTEVKRYLDYFHVS